MDSKAYAALLAASEECGMPTSHRADLTEWDRKWVEKDPSPFLWLARETGTFFMRPGERRAWPLIDQLARDYPRGAWYWWDGQELHKVDPKMAKLLVGRGPADEPGVIYVTPERMPRLMEIIRAAYTDGTLRQLFAIVEHLRGYCGDVLVLRPDSREPWIDFALYAKPDYAAWQTFPIPSEYLTKLRIGGGIMFRDGQWSAHS